jgi:hypothetical protein
LSAETCAFRWVLVAAGTNMLGCFIFLPDSWRGRAPSSFAWQNAITWKGTVV